MAIPHKDCAVIAIRLFCFVFSKQTTRKCIGEVLYSDISHASDDI